MTLKGGIKCLVRGIRSHNRKTISLSPFVVGVIFCDATGRKGISPLEKVTDALRMLCYRVPTDYMQEKIQVGE